MSGVDKIGYTLSCLSFVVGIRVIIEGLQISAGLKVATI